MNPLTIVFIKRQSLSVTFIFLFLISLSLKAQWKELGGNNSLKANSSILSICSDNPNNIYAAGQFTNSDGDLYVAKFDGNNWMELGDSKTFSSAGALNFICTDAIGNVYVDARFQNDTYVTVGVFNGTSWSKLGGDGALQSIETYPGSKDIYALCTDRFNNVYAAGDFKNTGGYNFVAKYNGSEWSDVEGTNTLKAQGSIYAICTDPSGNIYAAGDLPILKVTTMSQNLMEIFGVNLVEKIP